MKPEQTSINRLYALVFGTVEGRKVLADIHRYTRFKKSVFNPDSERSNCYAQGMQDVSSMIEMKIEKEIGRSLSDDNA